ncbi:MAG TPA: phosphonate ABC transporter, permease protein PhnE [Anaerolineales bacterium]|nr:phosphonate ABC transporter, permease protein PhnE [Anaerolineales bacterium]
MATTEIITPPTNSNLSALFSLILPGLGQFLQKRRGRGLLIFLTTATLVFLITWSLVTQNIGKIQVAGFVTSWLWLPLILFWVWNILDARLSKAEKSSGILPAILFVAIIIYVIAWQVTGVRLDRLVKRFGDARVIATDLVNPDIVTISINGQDQICAWDCMSEYIGHKLAGRTPQGVIRLSENFLNLMGRSKVLPASKWQVRLNLAEPGTKTKQLVAGTLLETIAMGLMATIFSTILAIPVSFLAAHNIVSRLPGGNVLYYAMRGILNFVRAVDTFIWGIIIITWVGLGSFAGVIALTIHSVAALAKLFSEEIEHIDPGPVEAVTATGANLIQTISHAVVPQIVPSFLAYSLLRWDINMRMATVLGFVAGGGIGFMVVETVRMGGYQQYATILWAVAVVIIIVDYISAKWREAILADQPQKDVDPKQRRAGTLRWVFYGILGAIVFIYFWNLTGISLRKMMDPGPNFLPNIVAFVTIDLSPDMMKVVVKEMLVTIFQALLATTLGAILALPISFLAAKNLTGRSRLSMWLYYLTRGILNVMRSIEALLYVVIFVFWVGVGPFAGMLGLTVTSFALIGKLFSEAIENIEDGPIEAVTATGANRLQVIVYAVLPQIVPPFISYLIYQWDINVRMATIIGFAGGGGVGFILSTFFNSLQYHKAGTVVAAIVIVVALMDFASAKLRQAMV